jgi:myosin heavy subunit
LSPVLAWWSVPTGTFVLFHYAGRVNYDPQLFLEKNKDTLFKDIEDCLHESTVPLIARMFGDHPPGAAADAADGAASGGGSGGRPGAGGSRKGKKETVGGRFRSQLDSLMATLYSANPHYIRCIKPNSVKKPDIFEGQMILEQVRIPTLYI